MDRRAHFKPSSLMQRGAALLCVLFCLVSGCQQVAQQPAGEDPDLAALAAQLSAEEAKATTAAADQNVLVASSPTAEVKKAEAAPAAVKTEATATNNAATLAAPKKTEPAPAAAKKAEGEAAAVKAPESSAKEGAAPGVKTEAPVKKAEPAAASAPTANTAAAAEAGRAPAASSAAAAGGSSAPAAETVPKADESGRPVGAETMEGTSEPGTSAEPKEEVKPADLTAVIIGGKEIVISEPVPLKTFSFAPAPKAPTEGLDTTALAAPKPVETTAVVAVTSEPAASEEGATEEEAGRFKGLLGMGRTALGYAADHYVLLGSVAIAMPAVVIFARKRKVIRRAFRKMDLDD